MNYSADILNILLQAPEGLSVRKIVRHVYNAHNTLFETVELEDVKRYVTQYLASRSKTSTSPIEHTGQRGVYRLNPLSSESRELMLQFQEEKEGDEDNSNNAEVDTSMDMFSDFFK